ncbi:MAG: hypothetical protein LWX23_05155 [Spirochaetia bacterium]|nr:hypothetical protein [Spirochaetia bacterium]MCE1208845.1 hypothetical protein [Spirochaetia bacterium]
MRMHPTIHLANNCHRLPVGRLNTIRIPGILRHYPELSGNGIKFNPFDDKLVPYPEDIDTIPADLPGYEYDHITVKYVDASHRIATNLQGSSPARGGPSHHTL